MKIKKIKSQGQFFYPATVLDAVKDASAKITVDGSEQSNPNYGKTVREILAANEKEVSDLKTTIDSMATDSKVTELSNAIATLNGSESTTGSVANSVKNSIDSLDVAAVGGDGKVITTVSEADGKISATAIDLTASKVASVASVATDDKVAVTGDTVADAIASLATSIKEAEKSAAKYTVKKVTEGLDSNVKEAYQLVETVNGVSTDVNVQIPIYKDSSLTKVELTDTNDKAVSGQFLKFTYVLADGSTDIVYLDCSKFLVESEFKNGLDVNDSGEVSVKVDTTSEDFLSVSEDGVKVSGIQNAINNIKVTVASDKVTDASGNVFKTSLTVKTDSTNYVDASDSSVGVKVSTIEESATGLADAKSVYDYALTAADSKDTNDYTDLF